MKRGLAASAVMLALTVAARAPVGAPAAGATLDPVPEPSQTPVGTAVAARLLDRLSSQEARTGQRFAFETTAPVTVGWRTIPAKTRGYGEVVLAQSGRGKRAGVLRVQARELDPPGAPPLPVAVAPGDLAVVLDPRVPAILAGGTDTVAGVSVASGTASAGGRALQTNVVYEPGTPFHLIVLSPASPIPTGSPGPSIQKP